MAKAKADQSVAELPILVKADVQGSAEAIVQAMEKIGNDEVRVRVLHSGVGAITDTDVASGRGQQGADHRLQRPGQCDGAGLGHPEGCRDPLLLDHL